MGLPFVLGFVSILTATVAWSDLGHALPCECWLPPALTHAIRGCGYPSDSCPELVPSFLNNCPEKLFLWHGSEVTQGLPHYRLLPWAGSLEPMVSPGTSPASSCPPSLPSLLVLGGPQCRAHEPLPPLSPPTKCVMNIKIHFPGPQPRHRAAHDAGSFAKALLWAGDGTLASRKKGLGLGGQGRHK